MQMEISYNAKKKYFIADNDNFFINREISI